MSKLGYVIEQIAPYKDMLNKHPLYASLTSIENVSYFMKHHIFCVWDFMNLLTYLQRELTCISIPWKPKKHSRITRLINEIVLEEESDIIEGETISHFEYYVKALKVIDSQKSSVDMFVYDLEQSLPYEELILKSYIPDNVRDFLNSNLECIKGSVLETAVSFSFGRESLVPELFQQLILQDFIKSNQNLYSFISYLERHIQLDGEKHSKLAFEMIQLLCENNSDWDIVLDQAIKTLQSRLSLWDYIYKSMPT